MGHFQSYTEGDAQDRAQRGVTEGVFDHPRGTLERPISDIFADPVWSPVKAMSGSFFWLLFKLIKQMKFDTTIERMKAILIAEKEDHLCFMTIYDLLMKNDVPPLHECKSYRGIHHYEIHRQLGELSNRRRRPDQEMTPTAPIKSIWPQTISAKDFCQRLKGIWGK